MGIEFSRSYKASDGKCYATLKEAQKVEISKIIGAVVSEAACDEVADCVIDNAGAIVNILTMSDNSRPKARGIKKPRKPKSNSALPDYTETQRPDGVQTAA